MINTPEEAKELWCPMARVAQAGHTDINVAYNRSLTKSHRLVRVAVVKNPDDFELGETPMPETGELMALSTDWNTSLAANCLGDKCAMWRWVPTTESVPVETEGMSGPARTWKTVPTQTHGYCGLAGRPEVAA